MCWCAVWCATKLRHVILVVITFHLLLLPRPRPHTLLVKLVAPETYLNSCYAPINERIVYFIYSKIFLLLSHGIQLLHAIIIECVLLTTSIPRQFPKSFHHHIYVYIHDKWIMVCFWGYEWWRGVRSYNAYASFMRTGRVYLPPNSHILFHSHMALSWIILDPSDVIAIRRHIFGGVCWLLVRTTR